MKRLPRPIADLICLWRDLARHPRQVLLNRSHHQWRGAGFIALVAALVVAGVPGFGAGSLVPALLVVGPSWLLDLAGSYAHRLWETGRIWPDLDCECCGEDPDDGGDAVDPPAPDDDDWLGCELERLLRDEATTPTTT
ncbi:hypothetical protein ABZ401_19195 [Streptomyces sp. NPDC005892]|uniref:hypothetical protein n=1 Tax=Streptomyces sp. NPDC005892 TaxID=3155593 RepID=UPI0033F4F0A3